MNPNGTNDCCRRQRRWQTNTKKEKKQNMYHVFKIITYTLAHNVMVTALYCNLNFFILIKKRKKEYTMTGGEQYIDKISRILLSVLSEAEFNFLISDEKFKSSGIRSQKKLKFK